MQRTDSFEGKRQRRANGTKVLSNTVRNKKEQKAREQSKRVFAESHKGRFGGSFAQECAKTEWWKAYVFVCALKEVKGMS